MDKKYNFNHKCSTKGGSSGSPILNIKNKLIGIHKEGNYNGKQYNKGLFLNYPIKEFIQKFKNKYESNILDIGTTKLNLRNYNIGNEGLDNLNKIYYIALEELYLNNNNISDIKVLEKVKFEKLEVLSLSGNEINLTKNNLIISKLKSLLKKFNI